MKILLSNFVTPFHHVILQVRLAKLELHLFLIADDRRESFDGINDLKEAYITCEKIGEELMEDREQRDLIEGS